MSKKAEENAQLEFDGQRQDETLLFVFRRHIIAMRKGFYLLLITFAFSCIPPLIWQNSPKVFIVPIVGFILGMILLFYHFIIWYFTVYIVTDQRIRQITQRGLFGKDVIELRLSKIQNISYNVPGFAGELFKYGTIVIQTFVGDLVIRNVARPDKVYNMLQDAVSAIVDEQGENEEVV